MTDHGIDFEALWFAIGVPFVLCFLCFGSQLPLRRMKKKSISQKERVRFSSDVNTELVGFQIGRNYSNLLIWSVCLLVLLLVTDEQVLRFLGLFCYGLFLFAHLFQKSRFQKMQSYLLTDRGVWLFPERLGRPIWRGTKQQFLSFADVDGYRIDGSYLQFFQEGKLLLQLEYAIYDYETVKEALYELNVQRLDVSDRIWMAQLNEELLFQLEDEACEMGWKLLELFGPELLTSSLQPEFGVMRNMPGDRLYEEYARSWLQINLLGEDGTVQATSTFPLWQSNGSVGYLIGVRGQELIDRIQQWLRRTLLEADVSAAKGGVS